MQVYEDNYTVCVYMCGLVKIKLHSDLAFWISNISVCSDLLFKILLIICEEIRIMFVVT